MKEITVLLLDQMFSSTAIGRWKFSAMQVRCEHSHGIATSSKLSRDHRSADGRPVRCDGEIQIQPTSLSRMLAKPISSLVPTTGLSVDDVVERNAEIVPWLKRGVQEGLPSLACAPESSGRGGGLLDGKRATTIGIGGAIPRKIPRVKWMPD